MSQPIDWPSFESHRRPTWWQVALVFAVVVWAAFGLPGVRS
jgi:hypothetical protein